MQQRQGKSRGDLAGWTLAPRKKKGPGSTRGTRRTAKKTLPFSRLRLTICFFGVVAAQQPSYILVLTRSAGAHLDGSHGALRHDAQEAPESHRGRQAREEEEKSGGQHLPKIGERRGMDTQTKGWFRNESEHQMIRIYKLSLWDSEELSEPRLLQGSLHGPGDGIFPQEHGIPGQRHQTQLPTLNSIYISTITCSSTRSW